MPWLLNCVYLVLIALFSPLLLFSALRKGKYREGWGAKLLGRVPIRSGRQPCVWLHAVSVGEVNLLQPILAELTCLNPTWEYVISTTTRTGYALARKKYASHIVFYCPLDFSWAVRNAMRRIRPDLLVLAELELWPNLIRQARHGEVRVAVVNGRLSEHSYRGYRRIRWLVRAILQQVDLIAAQDVCYADRFRDLGTPADRLVVTGSIKFDGARTERDNPVTQHLRSLWGLSADSVVLLAGSTQSPEELLALEAFRSMMDTHPELYLILVPRHPERFDEVAASLDQSGMIWQRRSLLDNAAPVADSRVLLVDVVGELGAWWGTAHAGFVWGSMGSRGGQNMIEPAGYGVAVCFGPNTWNFRDIVHKLLQQDAAVVVHDGPDLIAFFRQCVENREYAQRLGQRARRLVLQQQGATKRTVELLQALVRADSPNAIRKPRSAA